jgi:hypothetical protein
MLAKTISAPWAVADGGDPIGHQLAGYICRHRERWDITAVLEPLQLLGAKTGQVNVHLHRSPREGWR